MRNVTDVKTLISLLVLTLLIGLAASYPNERFLMPPWYRDNPYLLSSTVNTDQCVCMNWKSCEGRINSDVQCPSSYFQVCCTKPEPENKDVPYYNGEDDHYDSLELESPSFIPPGMEEVVPY